MNKKLNFKEVLTVSVIGIIFVLICNYFFASFEFKFYEKIEKYKNKLILKQEISPERLYINAWRIIRNNYYSPDLNGQNWSKWRLRYKDKIKTYDDAYVAVNTMIASLNDPYTKYLDKDLYKRQKKMLESKTRGFGIIFDKSEDKMTIRQVLRNSSASKAKIKAGDEIKEINGIDVKDPKIKEIIKKAESGDIQKIYLTLRQNNKTVKKELIGEDIYIPTIEYEIHENGVAIIRILNMSGEKAPDDFKKAIKETNNIKGLIIDLRNNSGGMLSNALKFSDLTVKSGKLLEIESGRYKTMEVYATEKPEFKPKPIIVLTNRKTASSAEIFAGILRDKMKATIIGERTYGKNTIQQIFPMHNYSAINITTNKYILPSGKDIYKKGLIPDIEIKQKYIEAPDKDRQMITAEKILLNVISGEK